LLRMGLAEGLGRCFVTGCAGFIGSHLTEVLLADGNSVTGYDNLSSGSMEWVRPLLANPRFSFIQADLRDQEKLTVALQGHDLIWHFGANTDIPGGNQDPRIDFENDIVGTFNLLQSMRASGTRKLLFASSSTVFGETELKPTPESVGPELPITQYGAGKMAGEGLISAFCYLYGMQAWMFRFGNVIGARMGHGVIYDFIQKLRRDPRELEILGDGHQEKNYFLVEDCIDGILHAYRHDRDKRCDVYHLGNNTTTRVTEIASIVADEMGLKDVKHHFTGGRQGWPGDVPVVMYDTTKMHNLGWQARHTSSEAVRIAARRLLAKA
ncbi:MAG: NAD-dependent epimerase/dehydratase family protein, partial [Dehalococcoidia bacterium]